MSTVKDLNIADIARATNGKSVPDILNFIKKMSSKNGLGILPQDDLMEVYLSVRSIQADGPDNQEECVAKEDGRISNSQKTNFFPSRPSSFVANLNQNPMNIASQKTLGNISRPSSNVLNPPPRVYNHPPPPVSSYNDSFKFNPKQNTSSNLPPSSSGYNKMSNNKANYLSNSVGNTNYGNTFQHVNVHGNRPSGAFSFKNIFLSLSVKEKLLKYIEFEELQSDEKEVLREYLVYLDRHDEQQAKVFRTVMKSY